MYMVTKLFFVAIFGFSKLCPNLTFAFQNIPCLIQGNVLYDTVYQFTVLSNCIKPRLMSNKSQHRLVRTTHEQLKYGSRQLACSCVNPNEGSIDDEDDEDEDDCIDAAR
jgi:hypothetical protein